MPLHEPEGFMVSRIEQVPKRAEETGDDVRADLDSGRRLG